MTQAISSPSSSDKVIGPISRVVNGLLAVKPLANAAKQRARSMMIQRAAQIGVFWMDEVAALRSRQGQEEFSADWDIDRQALTDPNLVYPDYYLQPFHAYEEGNLGWEPAMEFEVAAYAVHSRVWQEVDPKGDARMRQTYQSVLSEFLETPPATILDLGCSAGLSTFAMQSAYPTAQVTGLDLSPYFLAIAQYQNQFKAPHQNIRWLHAPAEATGLPSGSFDLVSAHLIFHELPQTAAIAILQEARRLLRPGGTFAVMDMNPRSEIYSRMPPYILTLLKSTEPWLDQYFDLPLETLLPQAGFTTPKVVCHTPRHRVLLAQVL